MNTDNEILVIGGGVIGLAIALELRLKGAIVTVLSRDTQQAAARAAAGMLAPRAETLPPGALLDLCLKSRALYTNWIRQIEELSGQPTGYWACGILTPLYQRPAATGAIAGGQWLEGDALRYAQPGLSPDVVGGWWFPEDGVVDNRALVNALQTAVQAIGVTLQEGITVSALHQHQGRITGVQTNQGIWQADQYVLATGAWAQELLPIPVQPRKGQMLSVRVPSGDAHPLPLQRILYGEEIYIVPRQDGRILLGATVESVGFTPHNTPAGIQQLLNAAMRLYPDLAHFPIEECWWGFRPATPDELPLLGASPFANLTLATGHYRNGILLAPVTALLTANHLLQSQPDPFLEAFSWQRFQTKPERNGAIAPVPVLPTTSALSFGTPVQTLNSTPSTASTPADFSLPADSPLVIAGRSFRSRLMTGTGKYRNFDEMRQSVAASGCEIVTVAVRRVQTNAPGHEGLAEALDWNQIWMLPNTAGCQTAEEAIRVARLGREMAKLLGQEDNNFVKLEVIPDTKYLLPDPIGTLQAAEQLVKEGFAVLPYINADPLLAKRLEEVGCATVMPLGSPIGSGQGIRNTANIQIIIENAQIPVVVDAGIGAPSEAAQAMEMGADALLINTAIAQAQHPAGMAQAMKLAAEAGRLAFLSGRIPIKTSASASSPLTGLVK